MHCLLLQARRQRSQCVNADTEFNTLAALRSMSWQHYAALRSVSCRSMSCMRAGSGCRKAAAGQGA
jgi:hypothetical protein